MAQGSMRCDVNVSIKKSGDKELGTRAELKNINSFKFIEKAINFEIDRQIRVIESGKSVVQETRLYDCEKNETRSMRSKEEADEYRYFPDPDLPLAKLSPELIETLRKKLPELPDAKKQRFMEKYGLNDYDAGVLTASQELSEYFEKVLADGAVPKIACNWITGDLTRVMNESGKTLIEINLSSENVSMLELL